MLIVYGVEKNLMGIRDICEVLDQYQGMFMSSGDIHEEMMYKINESSLNNALKRIIKFEGYEAKIVRSNKLKGGLMTLYRRI
jgi:hypothetical protein